MLLIVLDVFLVFEVVKLVLVCNDEENIKLQLLESKKRSLSKTTDMIKASITPTNNVVHLNIPNNYIGKKVEVLIYTDDEVNEEPDITNNVASLRGKLNLSTEEYNDFQKHIQESRSEWK